MIIALGKEYVKGLYCHPAYLTYKQGTSCELPGWMKYKLESRLQGEISITSDIQPVHSEGDQPWDFFGRNDAKAETPALWPPHAKS